MCFYFTPLATIRFCLYYFNKVAICHLFLQKYSANKMQFDLLCINLHFLLYILQWVRCREEERMVEKRKRAQVSLFCSDRDMLFWSVTCIWTSIHSSLYFEEIMLNPVLKRVNSIPGFSLEGYHMKTNVFTERILE